MKTVYLSLGSNLGDRESQLARAREQLETEETHVLRQSSVYQTAPRDVPDQPWFLNQVVEIETGLMPMQLLARTQKLERALGRVPSYDKGPRAIDIDILFFGSVVVSSPKLEIPHPRLAERRFVLEPLAELAPELKHPKTRRTVREMLAQVGAQRVHKL